ncbi:MULTISPECIES: DUF4825 domain-containing protein [Paenibacillus]|uniref:DUF4825 domain-containing protein n=1 Tax=Paenibacillus TaxID=44249 RepID=UPI0021A8BA26|nr:DUF4825 domain-containing protein [Paenibacillus sp. p3-SID1389]MCT2193661.1 DUF4825 domain-containing protein [Paenibacillus sp. p3-SID1389]
MTTRQTFKRWNIGIFALLLAGFVCLGVVEGVALPRQDKQGALYNEAQNNPLTHDITRTASFATPYMGNASKVSGLFLSLPLGPIRSFALDPDVFTVQVNLDSSVPMADVDRDRAYLYSATAAFAYIDNLEAVIFNEGSAAYRVTREELLDWYGVDQFSSLTTDHAVWQAAVQNKLTDRDYAWRAFQELFHETETLSV